MPHDTPLISTIVAGLVLAFIFGTIANRLRMPPLVGYLVAGIAVGPFTPGFVANAELAGELSEIGVILLMFGVGLHFSLKDMLSVQAVAIPGALLLIAGGTGMGMAMGAVLGWPIGGGIVFGLALSVASTVVLLKALQERHLVESDRGRIAIGWVIVEDIAMVLALVLIPAFAGVLGGTAQAVHDPFVDLFERLTQIQLSIWGVLGVTVVKLAAFVGFMLVVGRRVIPWILHLTAHTGSRELFRLAVLAIALGVAAGAAYLFGVSLALGAFFAGMILSESELSNRAAQESLPFRDAFSVLFFVSVGMLFDPAILITHPIEVIVTLFIVLIGKTALAFFLVLALKRSVSAALTISASLAQIGEFSFILASLGLGLGLLPPEGQSYILAGAIISIVLNPVMMYLSEHARPQVEARAAASGVLVPDRVEPALTQTNVPSPRLVDATDERVPTQHTGHSVIIGYGRVGTVVADGLQHEHIPFVLIEDAEKRVAAAHDAGIEVVVGNAASGKALALANIAAARTLLIAIPNAFEAGQAVEQARRQNAGLTIVARAHSDEEVSYLKDLGANEVIMGEREIGLGMLSWANGEAAHETIATRTKAGFDAVAAALKISPTDQLEPAPAALAPRVAPEPIIEVETLEARIEAAHPEHEASGPAEPPQLVPAFGETPLDTDVPEGPVAPAAAPEPVFNFDIVPLRPVEPHATPVPEMEPETELVLAPEPEPEPPKLRAAAPATVPAMPFNPEVPPRADDR